MKRISTSAIALAAAFLASPASAADIGRGGMKDAPVIQYSEERNSNHSGFYIKGDLGISSIDRDVSRTVNRGIDLDVSDPAYTALLDGADGSAPDGVVSEAEKDAASAQLDTVKIPHSFGDDNLTIPLIGDKLNFGDNADIDSFVFGGEASYLYQIPNSRFGFEIGIGVTAYSDADSTHGYVGANGKFVSSTALADADFGGGPICTGLGTCAGDTSPFSQSGIIKFDRDLDIDLVGRFYYFATPNLALNVGGGLSWARANITAANVDDTGFVSGLDTKIDKDVSSLGYVLTAGATYWATDRITIGVAYDYKHHTFDAKGSATDSLDLGGGVSLEGHASDRIEIEDDVHTIKARIGIKLN
jgi:opacity protein-like surface antigen